ncbi:ATP-dependent Clp protease adaptor ClpS [Tundrisphaera lichenicola]|uniref:ATP-dependent Clp protease adaptor ClpS n=1 Tax=Tundrisphaera lichenicola TaxID=2029860 RepID=UPI003EBE2B12
MSEPDEGDVAVDEPIVTTRTAPKERTDSTTKTRRQSPYHVIILNDEEHTFEYVIELLVKIFGHSLTNAEHLTWRVHNSGRAIVMTTHKELAELKCDQVLSYGPDPRMSISKGPIGCYIEPAPTD